MWFAFLPKICAVVTRVCVNLSESIFAFVLLWRRYKYRLICSLQYSVVY